MPQATRPKKRTKPAARENGSADAQAEEVDAGPSPTERATAGLKMAEHLQKAAAGGKIRKGWSLWRASKQLPVAAAGAGDLFKRHPVPIAIAGGVLATAGILLAAQAIGAFDADTQAEGQAENESRAEDDDEADEDAEEDDA